MSRKNKEMLKSAIKGVVIFLICFGTVLPFLWMVAISFRNKVDIFTPGSWLVSPTLQNYITIVKTNNIFTYFYNSIIVAVVTTLVSLLLGGFAAYGFARYNWVKKEDHAFFALSQKFLPAMAVVIPYFLMAALFNLLDTRLMLIICYTTFNIPFTIWMMRGFIEDLPRELEESAFIDGCTGMQTLQKIILPLVAPGLVATAIFCIINSWNEFVFANFLTTINSKTVPTSVMMYLSVSGVKWGEMGATGVLGVLPVLIFAICVQKHMIRGLTFGAIKG